MPQSSTVPPSSATVRDTVEKTQAKMKHYTDSKRGVDYLLITYLSNIAYSCDGHLCVLCYSIVLGTGSYV